MASITLRNQTADGQEWQAIFLPEKGMNLVSFKKGAVEVIDQSTRPLFEERYAGLGALIGPHFHRRKAEILPLIKDESLFPHIARIKAKGIQDPFSHGIARYAPWKAEATETSVKAVLSGKDSWQGVPLADLEGQNFKMEFRADLRENGLFLHLSVVSDTASLVGIHYYYALTNGKGKITAHVQNFTKDTKGHSHPLNPEWLHSENKIHIQLGEQDLDSTFRPYPNPCEGHILLETEHYDLKTTYHCVCEENAWQLYHPANSSFVCIEPVSAQDPRHANLSVSTLDIHLEIFDKLIS